MGHRNKRNKTYHQYLQLQLEKWSLLEEYPDTADDMLKDNNVMLPVQTQHVVFFSAGRSVGDTAPLLTLAEAVAELKIPNVRIIIYGRHVWKFSKADNIVYCTDLTKLLELEHPQSAYNASSE